MAEREPARKKRWQEWFVWWPGAWTLVVLILAVATGLIEWVLARPGAGDAFSITRIALTSPSIPGAAVRPGCNQDPGSGRIAHVHLVLWNAGRGDERPSSGANTVDVVRESPRAPEATPQEGVAKSQAPALVWAGVTRSTDKAKGLAASAHCRGDVVEIRWQGPLPPEEGFLVEALYTLGEDTDPGDLAFRLESSLTKIEDRGAWMPAADREVALTRRILMWTLWVVALALSGAAAHRAVSDFLFGLKGGGWAFLVVAALLIGASWLLVADRVMLYQHFPLALLPDR